MWSDLERLVAVVVDHSASMGLVIDGVRAGCASLGRALREQGIAVHFIIFDDVAQDGASLEELAARGRGTRISLAFELLQRLLAANGTPKQLDVVFVSDGEDVQMDACVRCIDGMPMPACRCRLFSVGVGYRFPTTLVTDHLYPVFGRDSDVVTPPVIPMENRDDAPGVFAQLQSLLSTARQGPLPCLEDFVSGMDPARLLLGAHQAYNACVHGCLFKRSVPEPEALEACAAILARIEALCMDAVRVRREAPQAKRALASQLLALDKPSAADALGTVQALCRQVKECVNRARRNVLLSSLDNDTKRNIAGFAGR